MTELSLTPLSPLDGHHERSVFDCGVPVLNDYLRHYALQNQVRGIVRNYVTTHAGQNVVVAFYSLVYGSLDQKSLPRKLVKGLGKYDVPIMLLARLAVNRQEQGQGLGKALLKDAVMRTVQAATIAGLKFLLVHAKDDSAANFYRKYGFEPALGEPLKLFLPISLSS